MVIIKEQKKIGEFIKSLKISSQNIGFVPTMGALHEGHISLIKKSRSENVTTVCSIFINPTQFNNLIDLKKYPVTLESDIYLLEKTGCDVLFLPTSAEMYIAGEDNEHYELGFLENILEGIYRPGHFQGVCIIVDKLLKAINPTTLYLGRKDYQQCMVISKMMSIKHKNVILQICETIREQDGLAMSSRNMRLNEVERQYAVKIIECLNYIKNNIQPGNLEEIKLNATNYLTKNGYRVDYTEIADANTLEIVQEWNGEQKLVALVAAFLNDVRLIDNIILEP